MALPKATGIKANHGYVNSNFDKSILLLSVYSFFFFPCLFHQLGFFVFLIFEIQAFLTHSNFSVRWAKQWLSFTKVIAQLVVTWFLCNFAFIQFKESSFCFHLHSEQMLCLDRINSVNVNVCRWQQYERVTFKSKYEQCDDTNKALYIRFT